MRPELNAVWMRAELRGGHYWKAGDSYLLPLCDRDDAGKLCWDEGIPSNSE